MGKKDETNAATADIKKHMEYVALNALGSMKKNHIRRISEERYEDCSSYLNIYINAETALRGLPMEEERKLRGMSGLLSCTLSNIAFHANHDNITAFYAACDKAEKEIKECIKEEKDEIL